MSTNLQNHTFTLCILTWTETYISDSDADFITSALSYAEYLLNFQFELETHSEFSADIHAWAKRTQFL